MRDVVISFVKARDKSVLCSTPRSPRVTCGSCRRIPKVGVVTKNYDVIEVVVEEQFLSRLAGRVERSQEDDYSFLRREFEGEFSKPPVVGWK